ncbi:hypothetical protein ACT4XR_20295 (plasmid) [Acinetobacter baumannii]|uniref:hypothetical protein n=1 Tax=Acinetobacter baumannii TaxID=470 RepID=UPI003891ED26
MKTVMRLDQPRAEKSNSLAQLLNEYDKDPSKFKVVAAPVDTSELSLVYGEFSDKEVKCFKQSK